MRRLVLAVLVATMCATAVWAYDFVENGLAYIVNDDQISVSVTSIYDADSMRNYIGLVSADIPQEVTHNGSTYVVTAIDRYAFMGCKELTSVTISQSVTSIGQCAFLLCSNLTTVTLPESLERLDYSVFSGCRSLANLVLPADVNSIGEFAFSACIGLKVITCQANDPSGIFFSNEGQTFPSGTFANCYVHVPIGSKQAYEQHPVFSRAHIVEGWRDGDINGDDAVDVTDINKVVNHILGKDREDRADVDHSGSVDVSDVNTVVNILLGKASETQHRANEVTSFDTYTVNDVSFTMVHVGGGTFTMGNEIYGPAHQVTLDDYSIGETEVTKALWIAVMGDSTDVQVDEGRLQQALTVSWEECQEFITRLNELTGQHFRMPTEAEWEFAARGGNQSLGYAYAGGNIPDEVACYWNSSIFDFERWDKICGLIGMPYHVAAFLPNELGLYDMSGNVMEWCQDWYGAYSDDAQTNPTGPETGLFKVLRGGCYPYEAYALSVAFRDNAEPQKDAHEYVSGSTPWRPKGLRLAQ